MPPIAATVVLYAAPAKPFGSELVVIARAEGRTVRLRVAVADCAVGVLESLTVITTEVLPAQFANVPEITPVELLMATPLGRPVALKVYGDVPPVTVIAVLYAPCAVPSGREVVTMASVLAVDAAETVRERTAVAACGVGAVESFTVIDTDATPTAVAAGVPVMAPVELLMVRPLGSPLAL